MRKKLREKSVSSNFHASDKLMSVVSDLKALNYGSPELQDSSVHESPQVFLVLRAPFLLFQLFSTRKPPDQFLVCGCCCCIVYVLFFYEILICFLQKFKITAILYKFLIFSINYPLICLLSTLLSLCEHFLACLILFLEHDFVFLREFTSVGGECAQLGKLICNILTFLVV